MARNTLSRSLHDLGLAAWFGGTLANAVALNPAVAKATTPGDVGAVTNTGWDRWTPVNAVASGMHLVGSVGQLQDNTARTTSQRGVATMVAVKTGLTVAALAATAYSPVLGRRVSENTDAPIESGTEPAPVLTPDNVAGAQRQLLCFSGASWC